MLPQSQKHTCTYMSGVCRREPVHSWLTALIKAKAALYTMVTGYCPTTSWGRDRGKAKARCREVTGIKPRGSRGQRAGQEQPRMDSVVSFGEL